MYLGLLRNLCDESTKLFTQANQQSTFEFLLMFSKFVVPLKNYFIANQISKYLFSVMIQTSRCQKVCGSSSRHLLPVTMNYFANVYSQIVWKTWIIFVYSFRWPISQKNAKPTFALELLWINKARRAQNISLFFSEKQNKQHKKRQRNNNERLRCVHSKKKGKNDGFFAGK